MNEKIKLWVQTNRIFFIILVVLFIWGLCGLGGALYWQHKCRTIQALIDNAGGNEFIDTINQQHDSILALQDDLVAVRGELEQSIGRTGELEQSIGRAFDIAEQSDVGFAELGTTMAGVGSTVHALIERQSRINEIIARLQGYNSAIKMELGMRP